MIAFVVVAAQFGAASLLAAHALLQLRLLRAARGARSPQAPQATAGAPPPVTVQLPIYNERFVVERLLESVAALRYPRELLEIQVLDDSTDDTPAIVDRWMQGCAPPDLRIVHVRRADRSGFKAGALAGGLRTATGELVAVFDADCRPPPDFLERALPWFADARVAVVQGRWGHANQDAGTLSRIVGLYLDVHFLVEQPGRAALGCFVNFNGSGGIWRRAAIDEAGGWSGATLTEDLDLSYRAQLSGWRVVYDATLVVPSDLPDDLLALRTQQHRWMKGVAENARSMAVRVARAPLPWRVRLHGIAHLLETGLFIALAATVALAVPVGFLAAAGSVPVWFALNPLLVLSFAALVPVYRDAHRHGAPAPARRFVPTYLGFLALSLGLAVHNGAAALAGYAGRRTPFVRTPKRGRCADEDAWRASGYGARVEPVAVLEAAAALACAVAVWFAARRGAALLVWPAAAYAFCGTVMLGLLLRTPRWGSFGNGRRGRPAENSLGLNPGDQQP